MMKTDKRKTVVNPYSLPGVVKHFKQTHPWVEIYSSLAARLANELMFISEDRSIRILEIGSGGGELALYLAKELQSNNRPYEMVLVEPSILMRQFSCHKEISLDPNVTICNDPYPNHYDQKLYNNFDCIIALVSLHHISNWYESLSKSILCGSDNMIFVVGTVANDAILVSTGDYIKSHHQDKQATKFWHVYHDKIKQLCDTNELRPSELLPWNCQPIEILFQDNQFESKFNNIFEVVSDLSYFNLLNWIQDGALTSLLALGKPEDRQNLKNFMTTWMDHNRISGSDIWSFHGGIRVSIWSRL